jgi:ABC-type branched-subunit amino acid transport system ATPase component
MMLKIEKLYGGYTEEASILKAINLQVNENETVAIVGQNGAGKSTLAKAIINMIPFISGNIYFKGENIRKKRTEDIINSGLNYFMQGGKIFPHLTVEENLNFSGISLSKKEILLRKEEVKSYFDLFKNSQNGRFSLEASYLSGGEQHQLALAMVMIKDPEFLILDEPSAGLSPGNVKKLYDSLSKIKKERKISILLIEQNVRFAYKFSDRVTLLKQGKIEKSHMDLREIEKEYFEKNTSDKSGG